MTEEQSHPRRPDSHRREAPHRAEHHGDIFVDDYEWMRDKDDPDTVAYLEAENAYTEDQTAHLTDLREAIFGEIKARTQETDLSVPNRSGGYWYYSRTAEGQQYPLLCRTAAPTPTTGLRRRSSPASTSLVSRSCVDCNELADGKDFFSLGAFTVSLDAHLLAYSTDIIGDERYTVHVKDLAHRRAAARRDPEHLARRHLVPRRHATSSTRRSTTPGDRTRSGGTRSAPTPPTTYSSITRQTTGSASLGRTTSRPLPDPGIGSKITSEARILDADRPDRRLPHRRPARDGVEYDVDHAVIGGEDRLVILHNKRRRQLRPRASDRSTLPRSTSSRP